MAIKINKTINTTTGTANITQVDKTEKIEELHKALSPVNGSNPVFTWKEGQAKKFIDDIVDESKGILKKFRLISGSEPTYYVSKILDNGSFLRPGGEYARTGGTGKGAYSYGTDGITLTTKTIEGKIYISDKEIEDNIEGNNITEHIQSITKRKIANELLLAAFYGRKLDNPSGENGILNVFNGLIWEIKQKGNVLNARDTSLFDEPYIDRKKPIKMKKTLATKYRQDAEYFFDSDVKTDFDELYNSPDKPTNGEIVKSSISGLTLNEVPLLRSDLPVADENVATTVSSTSNAGQKTINVSDDLTGSINPGDTIIVNVDKADEMAYTVASITSSTITTQEDLIYTLEAGATINKASLDGAIEVLTNPKNAIIYIQRDMKVEFERVAPDGYNVWYTMRMDQAVENPKAGVILEGVKTR